MAESPGIDTMRFVVIDDHPLYLEAVKLLVGRAFQHVDFFVTTSLDEAVDSLLNVPASLVLLDCSMPGMEGVAGVRRVVDAAGKAPVLMMSGVATSAEVAAYIKHGAKGFLPKTLESQVFTDAVSIVLHGGTYLPAEFMTASVAESPAPPPPPDTISLNSFSPREIELLRLVVQGKANKEISREMQIQEVTVKFYLTRLFRFLGVKNRAQCAVLAARLGIDAPDSAT